MRFISGLFIALTAAVLLSCNGNKTALLWTDRPEFALYGEYFNTDQNQYKVEVRYFDNPVMELRNSNNNPDIIVGSWLKNTSTGIYFKSLERHFGANKLSRNDFYPRLLAIGRIERNQYLLPISFNAPAMIFAKNNGEELSNPFTIGFEEIREKGREYNVEKGGIYSRMGFSPLWDEEFLHVTATLFNTSFREATPLAWDSNALNRSMAFIYNWTNEINSNNQAEGEFTFKYFFEPPAKLIQSERILFSYMDSSTFFTLNEGNKNNLDFRWIAEQNNIPLAEGSVYIGLVKKGKASKAAAAFIYWFFRIDTQRQLLENSKANRMDETIFGICGGFSALRQVTEQVFPKFYPGLLGRMPPVDYLAPANNLPGNWKTLKERVILPYLHDRARAARADEVYPLERRLADWFRVNR